MPARCPSTRGRWRCAAHRPLPSMMIGDMDRQPVELDLAGERLVGCPGGIHARRSSQRHDCCKSLDCRQRRFNDNPHGGGTARAAGAVGPASARGRCSSRDGHRLGLAPATADLDEGADNRSHHVTQEPVAADLIRRAGRRYHASSDRVIVRDRAAGARCPRFETPRNRACRRAVAAARHRVHIERLRQMPDVGALERVGDRRVPDPVPVGLRRGR